MPTPVVSRAYELHHPPHLDSRHTPEQRAKLSVIRRSLSAEDWAASLLGFHVLFNVPLGGETPGFMPEDREHLRFDMWKEEVREAAYAQANRDFIEYVDGKLDEIYIVLGDLLECGIAPDVINELFREVHASNMTKVDDSGQPVINGVTDGAREGEPLYRADQPVGKVLKGSNYRKPDIEGILRKAGWKPEGETGDGE